MAALLPCRCAQRHPPSACTPQALLAGFVVEEAVPDGRLVVRPLGAEDASAAAVVLTRSFATSLQGIPLKDGRGYVQEMLTQQPPRGVLLVARLFPAGARRGRFGACGGCPLWADRPPGRKGSVCWS